MQTDKLFQSGMEAGGQRRFLPKRGAILLGLATALGACAGSSVQRGAEFYTQQRYIDAAQVFEHTEPQLDAYDQAEQVEYALYRGATFLALGDRDAARHWLLGARRGQSRLSEQDRELLTRSLRAVDAETDAAVTPVVFESASGLAATPVQLSP